MEDAWVRMCNRRDAIPPICDIIIDVLVWYVLTVCLPLLCICTILYVINSVPLIFGSEFAI